MWTNAVPHHRCAVPLQQLRSLTVHGTDAVSDVGTRFISVVNELRRLRLLHCLGITGGELERFTHLTHLSLQGCRQIADSALAHIARIRYLTHLDLQGCEGVGDQGLQHLANMHYLRHLNLCWCLNATETGVETLLLPQNHQRQLVECQALLLTQQRLKNNSDGVTPLMIAASLGHVGIVTLLLEAGVDVCARNSDGMASLYAAAHAGHCDVIKALVNFGAEVCVTENVGDPDLCCIPAGPCCCN